MSYMKMQDIEAQNNERERRGRIADEIASVKAKLSALEVGTYHMGFCVGSMSLEKLFQEHLSAKVLGQIQDKLSRNADVISEEAHEWLEEARANLAQFAEYMLALEERLYVRLSELEDDLDSTEPTQTEINNDC